MARENSTQYYRLDRVFQLITLIVILLFIVPPVVIEGMFFDGLTYSSIARNIAIGDGTFWAPMYLGDVFYEHPPLALGIQSLFFKLAGQHFFIEKIYSFLVFVSTAFLIVKCWHLFFKEDIDSKKLSWLPVLAWCIIPQVMFAYPYNLLDTWMALFDQFAFLCCFKAIYAPSKKWLYYALASVFVFLAFFSKGPVGLFPIAVPGIYYFVFNKEKRFSGLIWSSFIAIIFGVIFWLVMLYEPANVFFTKYLDQQVFSSLKGNREKVSSSLGHFQVFNWLFFYLLPALVPVIISVIIFKKRKLPLFKDEYTKKLFTFLLLVAISATFPICLSIKQRAFYLIPGFIFYAMAFGVFLIHPVKEIIYTSAFLNDKIKTVQIILKIVIASSIVYCALIAGKPGRDKKEIHDIRIIQQQIPFGEKLGICNSLYWDWRLKAYLERYHHNTTTENIEEVSYCISDDGCDTAFDSRLHKLGFVKKELPLKRLSFYRKQ